MPKQESIFYSDCQGILGVISQDQYHLLGNFFSHHGWRRTLDRVNYINDENKITQTTLSTLKKEVEEKIGSERFQNSEVKVRCFEENSGLDLIWRYWQGSSAEVLAEEFALQLYPQRVVVSNQMLAEAIKGQNLIPCRTDHEGSNFKLSHTQWFACPDAVLLQPKLRRWLELEAIMEFKSKTGGIKESSTQNLRNLLADLQAVKLLTLATARAMNVPLAKIISSEQIGLKNSGEPRLELIALQDNSSFKAPDIERVLRQFDCHHIIGLDAGNFAYWLLKIGLGNNELAKTWAQLFTPISLQEAQAISYISHHPRIAVLN
jgi:hypothetical protein